MSTISYKDAGVDIDAGNSFIERIKPHVKSTFDSNVLGGIGSFAGAWALPTGYKEPVLLSATDGVGTKLKLAIDSNRFNTVGIDLVAMCVNDLICNFGLPSFFLDYYATAKLDVDAAEQVVSGIAEGCRRSECALIGGETAEMPGMYKEGDFDLAGFSVGIAERAEIDRSSFINEGDALIAMPSSGIHSNGYSLVRALLFDKLGMNFDDDFNGRKLIDVLLEPTRIYVKEFKKHKNRVNALAHITGGGIVENLPRVLDGRFDAVVDKNAIKTLPIFDLISKHVEESEMMRTFNMGVGMVWVATAENAKIITQETDGYIIGHLTKGSGKVQI